MAEQNVPKLNYLYSNKKHILLHYIRLSWRWNIWTEK